MSQPIAHMTLRRIHVSLVVFPECDPSIIYGVFDTLWAAGRLWNALKGLAPGEPMFEPRLVAADRGPLQLATGVSHVFVNGEAVLADGKPTGRLPGRLIPAS